MTESPSYDCEALLSQAGWVRALARHLTADAHQADDLAQDALAAALVRSPPGGRPLRGWLAGIVRNLAREERRKRASRSARERAVARDEADVSSAHLFERLELHRTVVEAVARLDEPYRAAILMRYFEELSPAVIAARTGTPLRTVHTRLHRALIRLRAELDRAHGGDRNAWLLALIPFARGSGGWSALGVGALVMDAKLKIALATVAVVGIWSTFALWPSETAEVAPAALAAAPEAVEVEPQVAHEPELPFTEAPATPERRAQESAPAIAAPVTAAPKSAQISGRVIDVGGAPVPGVRVRFFAGGHSAREDLSADTRADGRFEMEDAKLPGHIDVTSPGWASLYRPAFPAAAGAREVVLVVARSVRLAGVVVDERHHPISSAQVAVPMPFGLRARFEAILDTSSSVERSVQTDSYGRFALSDAPLFPGAELVTTHPVYLADERALPEHGEPALEILLRSAHAELQRIAGQVIDPDGNPVEGAWVALGETSTKSGPLGAFAFDLGPSGHGDLRADAAETTTLRAVKKGYLPVEESRTSARATSQPWVLRLGGPSLAIAGRVLDADGRVVAKAEVWTDEETHFGYIEIEGGETSMRVGANIEGILRGDPFAPRIRTDAYGRFELAGLLARDYRVHAFDRQHLLTADASFAAGVREIELRLPREPMHERVAGRVTSLRGDPVEGLQVVLERKVGGKSVFGSDRLGGIPAVTDADGRFAFEDVARAFSVVSVHGRELGVDGFERSVGTGDDVEKLELAVPMSVHVQVAPTGTPDFDEVAVLDAQGAKLSLSIHHGTSSYTMNEMRLQEGRTEPFVVSELARTLVLLKGDVEVRRLPLELERGELNTIRP